MADQETVAKLAAAHKAIEAHQAGFFDFSGGGIIGALRTLISVLPLVLQVLQELVAAQKDPKDAKGS
jgi:hypothetical protein